MVVELLLDPVSVLHRLFVKFTQFVSITCRLIDENDRCNVHLLPDAIKGNQVLKKHPCRISPRIRNAITTQNGLEPACSAVGEIPHSPARKRRQVASTRKFLFGKMLA